MFCPSCRREYPPGSTYCPFDANRLVEVAGHQDLMAGPAGGVCPTCKRGFNPGVKVCPHDGDELVPPVLAMPPPGMAAPRGKICPTCGDRFDGLAAFCGKDGTQLCAAQLTRLQRFPRGHEPASGTHPCGLGPRGRNSRTGSQMKISCQSCQAKYTIADDKVLGKIVKIRCKKCGETIVVNGAGCKPGTRSRRLHIQTPRPLQGRRPTRASRGPSTSQRAISAST